MCICVGVCTHVRSIHMPAPIGYPIISCADLSLEQESTSSKVVDVKRGQLKDEPTPVKAKS